MHTRSGFKVHNHTVGATPLPFYFSECVLTPQYCHTQECVRYAHSLPIPCWGRVDHLSGAGTGLSSSGASAPGGGTSFGAGSVSLDGAIVDVSRGVVCMSSLPG